MDLAENRETVYSAFCQDALCKTEGAYLAQNICRFN